MFLTFLPEVLWAITACVFLCGLSYKDLNRYILPTLIGTVFLALYMNWCTWDIHGLHGTHFENSPITILGKALLTFIACPLISSIFHKDKKISAHGTLLCLSIIGGYIVISAASLPLLYLGMEMHTLCLILLLAQQHALPVITRYFILSMLMSACIVLGYIWLYKDTGSVVLHDIYYTAPQSASYGAILISIGIAFKLAIVPLHTWAPDLYSRLRFSHLMLLLVLSKTVFVLLLIKWLYFLHASWPYMLTTLMAYASLLVGSIGCFRSDAIKKFFAYMSTGHVGFILLLSPHIKNHISTFYTYITLDTLSFLGLLLALSSLRIRGEDIKYWSHLRNPPAFLGLFLVSTLGVPPLIGFWPKFFVLRALLLAHNYIAMFAGALYMLCHTAYICLLIKKIYFVDTSNTEINARTHTWLWLYGAVVCIAFLSIPIISYIIQRSVMSWIIL